MTIIAALDGLLGEMSYWYHLILLVSKNWGERKRIKAPFTTRGDMRAQHINVHLGFSWSNWPGTLRGQFLTNEEAFWKNSPSSSPLEVDLNYSSSPGSTGRPKRTSVMRNDTESDVIRYLAESTGSKKTYCSRCILLRIASLDQDKRCSDKERKSGWLFFVHCYDAITFSSLNYHL